MYLFPQEFKKLNPNVINNNSFFKNILNNVFFHDKQFTITQDYIWFRNHDSFYFHIMPTDYLLNRYGDATILLQYLIDTIVSIDPSLVFNAESENYKSNRFNKTFTLKVENNRVMILNNNKWECFQWFTC